MMRPYTCDEAGAWAEGHHRAGRRVVFTNGVFDVLHRGHVTYLAAARALGATLVVANLQYSGIVFAALFGMVLFGDQIPAIGWAGMALIIASGIAATFLRSRALPNPPAEEH